MRIVFVSGCYDILHAGHVQFFKEARALGDHLTVCFASDEVLWLHKARKTSLPEEHKKVVLESLTAVDEVVVGRGTKKGLDFLDEFNRLKPDILAVTEDDQYGDLKKDLCERTGCSYRVLPKTPPDFEPVSTTQIVKYIKAPTRAPLRVDFAGGWLDVPRFAREGTFIVNCAIEPMVSLRDWPYETHSGLGGSGAWALLNGQDGIESELDLGVGWQDPAVIFETGICVWRSGALPILDFKRNPDLLSGKMAILWTGKPHDTPGVVDNQRDFDKIEVSGKLAREGVLAESVEGIAEGTNVFHEVQLSEGMDELPVAGGELARKYCGGGWGGYAMYLFASQAERDAFVAASDGRLVIEPYLAGLTNIRLP